MVEPIGYSLSKKYPFPTEAVPDLKLFENMEFEDHCKGLSVHGDDDEIEDEEKVVITCPAIQRLVAVLNFYNLLRLRAPVEVEELWNSQFIDFCDAHYGASAILEDYIHFMTTHSDMASLNQMAAALDCKCFGELKRCGVTTRHYRDRRREDMKAVHFYIDILDSVHLNVLHLVAVGLRVAGDDKVGHNQNEDGLVDEAVLKMSRDIESKREQCSFERLDETSKNSKFSLCSAMESN